MSVYEHLQLYLRLGLTPVPLKWRSKKPMVKWRNGWNPTAEDLEAWASRPDINWGAPCGPNLAVIDCDSEELFHDFTSTYHLPPDCPVVKTGRGYHVWVKPERPIRSQRVSGVEIKCIGSYVVAPPSVHPSRTPYDFVVVPNGGLPEAESLDRA